MVVARRKTTAEDAGDVDRVAGPGTGAGEHTRAVRAAEEGETGGEDAVGLGDISADDGHAIAAGAGGETAVELFKPCEGGARIQRERENGGGGAAAHGGEVAEVTFEEFGPDGAGRNRGVEVTAEDDGIDGDELRAARGGEDGAIVADAEGGARGSGAEPAADGGDEFCFAKGGDGLGGARGERGHLGFFIHGQYG
jgi:hypothetical protein